MSCRRISIIDFAAFGTEPFVIKLDCWAAQIRVGSLGVKGTVQVNGMDVFSVWQVGTTRETFIELPGMTDQFGLPINYNDELRFTNTSGSVLFGGITKTYLDVSRPDADPRIEEARAKAYADLLGRPR